MGTTTKRLKLKLSVSAFQFWRTKVTPSLPIITQSTILDHIYHSPINPVSLHISYPSDPPPPTPIHIMHHVSFNTQHDSPSPSHKNYNSPVAYNDSDDTFANPITPHPKCQNLSKKQRKINTKNTTSSGDSSWVSSDENKSLISSSDNFDLSSDFGNVIPIVNKSNTGKKKYDNDGAESPTYKNKSPSSSSVCRPSMTSAVNDESFVVVKNSQNPREDFKNSMMEMIMENKMFKAKDLEELLQCFLSLNSRNHHGAIIQAFSEIWHLMFL